MYFFISTYEIIFKNKIVREIYNLKTSNNLNIIIDLTISI